MKQFSDMTFIEQLQELKNTLQEAMQAENSRLKMDLWVNVPPEKPKHFCNTACCIMGYQAVKESDGVDGIELQALYLTNALEDTDDPVIRCLSKSIYFSQTIWRKRRARLSTLFSDEELNSINHLNKVHPSFQDAIDYLDVCIEKANSYIQQQDGNNVKVKSYGN